MKRHKKGTKKIFSWVFRPPPCRRKIPRARKKMSFLAERKNTTLSMTSSTFEKIVFKFTQTQIFPKKFIKHKFHFKTTKYKFYLKFIFDFKFAKHKFYFKFTKHNFRLKFRVF